MKKLFAPLFYLRTSLIHIRYDHIIVNKISKKLDFLIMKLSHLWALSLIIDENIENIQLKKVEKFKKKIHNFYQILPHHLNSIENLIEDLRDYIDGEDFIILYHFKIFIDDIFE